MRAWLGIVTVGFAMSAAAAPTYGVLRFSRQVINAVGSEGGVSFSWLTRGTNLNGGNVNAKWRISGFVDVIYDDVADEVELDPNGQQSISVNGGGSMTITAFKLTGPSDFSGDVIGHMTVNVSGVAGGASGVTVDYLDKSYHSSLFNSFKFDPITEKLTLRLWGNELIDGATALHSSSAGNPADLNWGTDWKSGGLAQVPTPSAALLGLIGMAMVRRIRRRNAGA